MCFISQKKKKTKEKHVAFLLQEEEEEEATAEEAHVSSQEAGTSRQEVVPTVQDVVVSSGQQKMTGPWLRKRKRRGNKAGMEKMAVDDTKKVGNIETENKEITLCISLCNKY